MKRALITESPPCASTDPTETEGERLLWLLGPAFRVKMPLPFLDWAVDKTRPLPGEFKAWSANQSAPQEILREIRRNFAQPVGARSAFNLFGLAENTCSLVEEIFQWLELHTIRLGSCAS